jgi:drug/metabolite transporter (DMT)-like permease
MTRQAWLLFVALSIIWGVPYFFIKIALHDLSPAFIAFARVALGALILLVFVPRSDWVTVRSYALAVAAVAAADLAIPFYLIANGERFISSSLTGLLLSALPIVVAVLALTLDRRERLARLQMVGLGIGVIGVAMLLGFEGGRDRATLVGAALVSGATLSYAVGVLLMKLWLSDLPMLATTAAMLVVAAGVLAPAAVLHSPTRWPGVPALIAITVLGAVCTAAANVMYFALIGRVGATRATVVTYLNPAVAALLGVVLLGESLSTVAIAGLLLVIAGSWLSTGGKPPGRLIAPHAAVLAPSGESL